MGFSTLQPGEVNNQKTEKPFRGQAACPLGKKILESEASKERLAMGHCLLYCNII